MGLRHVHVHAYIPHVSAYVCRCMSVCMDMHMHAGLVSEAHFQTKIELGGVEGGSCRVRGAGV